MTKKSGGYHCPLCGNCFAGYAEYISHFRVGGKLRIFQCVYSQRKR